MSWFNLYCVPHSKSELGWIFSFWSTSMSVSEWQMERSSWKVVVKVPVAQEVYDQDLNLERLYMSIVHWHYFIYYMY